MSHLHDDPEKVDAARVLAAMAFTSWPPKSSKFAEAELAKPKRSPAKRSLPARKRKREEEPEHTLADQQPSPVLSGTYFNALPQVPFGYGVVTNSTQPLPTSSQPDPQALPQQNSVSTNDNTNASSSAEADAQSSSRAPSYTFDDLVDTSQCAEQPSVISASTAISTSATNQSITAGPSKSTTPIFPILDAFTHHPDILLYLTTQHLHPQELLTLYTISKPFHYLVNSRYTTWMLCSARRWARLAPETRSADSESEGILWGTISVFEEENAAEQDTTDPSSTSTSDETPHYPAANEQTQAASDRKDKGKARATPSQPNKPPPPSADPMQPSRPGEYNIWDITTLLPFTNYVHLCTPDPTLRKVSPDSPSASLVRHVPTFRYLYFLLHRSYTVHSILQAMRTHGHPLPPKLATSLIKLWLLMDIPTTATRAALLRNRAYFTDADLKLLTLFFIKLDMLFTDPLDGDAYGPEGTSRMRECLLAQRSLSCLAGVVEPFVSRHQHHDAGAEDEGTEGTEGREKRKVNPSGAGRSSKNELDMLRSWVRWRWVPKAEHVGVDVLGVPGDAVGGLRWEGWTAPWVKEREAMLKGEVVRRVPGLLMPVDEGVMREGLRRGLKIETLYLLMMLHGHE